MTLIAKRELLSVSAVFLLAIVLRVGQPTLSEFKFSEARLEALALELTHEGRLPLVGVPSSAGFDHSPISVYLYVPAFLFAADPIPATVYSGLVGAAAVALCWWLARRWPGGGRWGALIAALLLAVSPWAVAFSRKIWQVTFVPLLTLAFIGLVISALVEARDKDLTKGQRWRLAWAIVVFALLVQVHPSAVSLTPAWLLWLIVFRKQVRVGPLLVGGVLGILTAVPFLLNQVQRGWPALSALQSLPEALWDSQAAQLAWEAIAGRSIHALAGDAYPFLKIVPQLGWLFNLVGWLTIGASLGLCCRMVRQWRASERTVQQAARVDLILLSWLLVPILFNLRHSLNLHLHFFALIIPAAYLLVGRAWEAVFSRVRLGAARVSTHARQFDWVRLAKILGVIVFGFLAAAQVVVLLMMARFVATHDTPGGFGVPLARYLDIAERTVEMARETGAAEVLVVGRGDSTVVDSTPTILDVLLRGKVAYRFVNGEKAAVFPPHQTTVLLGPDPGEAAQWYGSWPMLQLPDGYHLVALDGSWPQEGFLTVPGPRVFENGIELQGYVWELQGEEGGQFWLLWQVLWLSADNTHFFVHLLGEHELFWGQQDSAGYPTAYRQKADRVVSKFDITRTGEASVSPHWGRIGLYLYPQIDNVPVIDGAGNPMGDAVVVGPLGRGP